MWEGLGVLSGVLIGRACKGVRVWRGWCDVWGRDSRGSRVGSRGDSHRRARRGFAQGPRPRRCSQRSLGGSLGTPWSPGLPPALGGPPRRSAVACRCLVGCAQLYDHFEFHLRMAPGMQRAMHAHAAGRAPAGPSAGRRYHACQAALALMPRARGVVRRSGRCWGFARLPWLAGVDGATVSLAYPGTISISNLKST